MITDKVEMQSLKVNMVSMGTTFHKKNSLQYIYATILAQVVFLNV